jgi:hypothetical protein
MASTRPTPGIGKEILALTAEARRPEPLLRQSWLHGRELALDAARAGESPEREGQLAAQAVRATLSLDGQPIPDVPSVLLKFGVELRDNTLVTGEERMIAAAVADGRPVATVLRAPRTGTAWGQRFEEARALGHLLLDTLREGAIGAASTRYSQAQRRRRSGAFAAELLIPSTALEVAGSGHLDDAADPETFQDLLQRFGVGARTAANRLYDHRLLSSESVRDDLIEQFGSAQ